MNKAIQEHGEWCLQRMLGQAAETAAVAPESIPIYLANEAKVRRIMANDARKPLDPR